MKIRVFLVSLTVAGALCAGTVHAQTPKSPAEAQWQQFLTKHPNVQAGLVNDPKYLAKHQGMAKWLQEHPAVTSYARQQGQIGGWDKKNQWHDRNWWVHNDPAWVHEYHPDWAEGQAQEHPAGVGEWDEHHRWHDRNWWVHNDPAWVHHHHPEWVEVQARGPHDPNGGWDDHHHWHDRKWWMKHHPEWVHHEHPGWYESEEHGHHYHGEGHYKD